MLSTPSLRIATLSVSLNRDFRMAPPRKAPGESTLGVYEEGELTGTGWEAETGSPDQCIQQAEMANKRETYYEVWDGSPPSWLFGS